MLVASGIQNQCHYANDRNTELNSRTYLGLCLAALAEMQPNHGDEISSALHQKRQADGQRKHTKTLKALTSKQVSCQRIQN